MKINVHKSELEKIKKLFLTRENNIYLSELYNAYLIENKLSINKVKIESLMKAQKMAEVKAFYHLMLKATKYRFSEDELKFTKACIYPYIKKLDSEDYSSNPYYAKIKAPEIKNKDWQLKYLDFKPYQGFVYNDLTTSKDKRFLERTHIGFFDKKFPFLAVIQNNVTWMSITPHEIETMKDSIALMKGNICVFGLGLGYFPYMCSIKDEVNRITIVEKDSRVIDLFNSYLLPQFENKNKIKVICEDAFEFLSNAKTKFDYNFIDLWHNDNDGLSLYLESKKHEDKHPNTTFIYWIESAMIAVLRRLLLVLIEEQLEGFDSSHYLIEQNIHDKIINKLYFLLREYKIKSYIDVENLISDDSIKELAKKI